MKITVCIAGCLAKPERLNYLKQTVQSFITHCGTDAEYFIGLDNTSEAQGEAVKNLYPFAEVKVHTEGLGHSWNWGIKNATNDVIIQSEEDWACAWCWGKEGDHTVEKQIEFAMETVQKEPYTVVRLDNMEHAWYKPGYKPTGIEILPGKGVFELNRCDPRRWYDGWNPYFFSNHVHVKNKKFHDYVGYYMEKSNFQILMRSGAVLSKELVPQTEFDICKKVIQNPQTRILFFKSNAFFHIGDVAVR